MKTPRMEPVLVLVALMIGGCSEAEVAVGAPAVPLDEVVSRDRAPMIEEPDAGPATGRFDPGDLPSWAPPMGGPALPPPSPNPFEHCHDSCPEVCPPEQICCWSTQRCIPIDCPECCPDPDHEARAIGYATASG